MSTFERMIFTECEGGFEIRPADDRGWLFRLYDGRRENERDQKFLETQNALVALFTASPEIYEALKALSEERERLVDGDDATAEDYRHFVEKQYSFWHTAKEAIASAEGRTA